MKAGVMLRILNWSIDGAGRQPYFARRLNFACRRDAILAFLSEQVSSLKGMDVVVVHNASKAFALYELPSAIPHLQLIASCPNGVVGHSAVYSVSTSPWSVRQSSTLGLRLLLETNGRGEGDQSHRVTMAAVDTHLIYENLRALRSNHDLQCADLVSPLPRMSRKKYDWMQSNVCCVASDAESLELEMSRQEPLLCKRYTMVEPFLEGSMIQSKRLDIVSVLTDMLNDWQARGQSSMPDLLVGDFRILSKTRTLGPYKCCGPHKESHHAQTIWTENRDESFYWDLDSATEQQREQEQPQPPHSDTSAAFLPCGDHQQHLMFTPKAYRPWSRFQRVFRHQEAGHLPIWNVTILRPTTVHQSGSGNMINVELSDQRPIVFEGIVR